MRKRAWVIFVLAGPTACSENCDPTPVAYDYCADYLFAGWSGECSPGAEDAGVGAADAGPRDAASDGGTADAAASAFDSGCNPTCPEPPVVPANLVLVHAAPGVPPFRICFASGSSTSTATVTAISALPDTYPSGVPYGFYGQYGEGAGPYPSVEAGTPGIYPGTIGAFPALGLSYQNLTITLFAVLSSSIANDINTDSGAGVNAADGGVEEDCVHLIGTHGLGPNETASGSVKGRLVPGRDFWPLPPIASGTLRDNHTYLLALNGCLPGGAYDPTAQAAGYTCGGPDAGPWMTIDPLDTTTTVPAGAIGVQFAHRASAVEETPVICPASVCGTIELLHAPAGAGVSPVLIAALSAPDDGGEDAAPDAGLEGGSEGGADASPGDWALSAAPILNGAVVTPLSIAPVQLAAPLAFGVFVQPTDGGTPNAAPWPGAPGSPGDLFAMPLGAISSLSAWSATTVASPGVFQTGAAYTFVLVGDPSAAQLPDDGGLGAYDGRGVHFLAFPNRFLPRGAPGQ
jgi:hypothetical protein